MESTGLYGLDLALALQAQKGLEIMVANPRSVRHFGEALMQRSKTDPIDAKLLAEYGERMPFQSLAAALLAGPATVCHRPCHPSAHRHQHHAEEPTACCWEYLTTPKIIGKELRRSLAHQERAIERLLQEALRLLQLDPLLQKRFQLLLGICGIKELRAVQLYRHLRRALFMPALVGVRHDPYFRAFYRQLLAKGKLKMVAFAGGDAQAAPRDLRYLQISTRVRCNKAFFLSLVSVSEPAAKKMAC